MKEQLTSQEWMLLSSYLDGELNPREKTRVEALLKSNPDIQAAYESLAKTKAVLRSAPRRKVPRNFTLSAAAVQQPRQIFQWVPALRFSSVIATLAAVFLFVSQLLPGMAARPLTAEQPAMEMLAIPPDSSEKNLASPEADLQETPPVVYWGGPPPPPSLAEGLGGGGVDAPHAGGMGGGGADPGFKAQGFPESLPQPGISLTPPTATVEPLPLEGSGPILGVRESEDQGKALDDDYRSFVPSVVQEQEAVTAAEPSPSLPYIAAGGLLALAAGLWLISILLKKKSL